jgi:hypothetical protein
LIGNGDFNGLTTVVAFNGTRNGINDCEIDGEGVATHGVVIATASVGDNHFLDRANIHSAVSDGVLFLDPANGFNAYQSTITGNGAAGINFGAMPRNGYFQQNTWTGNTGSDVLCGDPSPGLNGDSNTIGTCVGCDNCPF